MNTRKQLLISDENIRIRDWLKYFRTSHVIRSTLMPSICKSELVWLSYGLCKITVRFLWNASSALSFIMHYTEYFSMRNYAGFSQIGSHMLRAFLYFTWPVVKHSSWISILKDREGMRLFQLVTPGCWCCCYSYLSGLLTEGSDTMVFLTIHCTWWGSIHSIYLSFKHPREPG